MTLVVRAIVGSADATRVGVPDLVVVRADGVAALASSCAEPPPPTEAELRTHEAITRCIHEGGPSLPSRFGEVFADESALAAALERRAQFLAQSLAAVGARVELAITLAWRSPHDMRPAADAVSGTDYLEAKRACARERREAEQVVARLVEQLPCERAFIRHRMCPREGIAASVAILCARDEVSMLRRAVGSFGERSSEVSALVHGPLPPYSFAA